MRCTVREGVPSLPSAPARQTATVCAKSPLFGRKRRRPPVLHASRTATRRDAAGHTATKNGDLSGDHADGLNPKNLDAVEPIAMWRATAVGCRVQSVPASEPGALVAASSAAHPPAGSSEGSPAIPTAATRSRATERLHESFGLVGIAPPLVSAPWCARTAFVGRAFLRLQHPREVRSGGWDAALIVAASTEHAPREPSQAFRSILRAPASAISPR